MTEQNNNLNFQPSPVQTAAPAAQPQAAAPQPQAQPNVTMAQAAATSLEGNAQPVSAGANASTGGMYDNNFAADLKLPPKFLQTKFIALLAGCVLCIGMFFGCVMAPTPVCNTQSSGGGLQGVVPNPFFQARGYPYRCGEVDPNYPCVLYIMNAKTRDRMGNEFYEEAANMTGVPKYSIQISNVDYANKMIRPGYIAEIYIPARR